MPCWSMDVRDQGSVPKPPSQETQQLWDWAHGDRRKAGLMACFRLSQWVVVTVGTVPCPGLLQLLE